MEEARFISKKIFDEALEMLIRFEDEEDYIGALPVIQAIKDNYDLWETDLVS